MCVKQFAEEAHMLSINAMKGQVCGGKPLGGSIISHSSTVTVQWGMLRIALFTCKHGPEMSTRAEKADKNAPFSAGKAGPRKQ
jgi:hypothetical protein